MDENISLFFWFVIPWIKHERKSIYVFSGDLSISYLLPFLKNFFLIRKSLHSHLFSQQTLTTDIV